MSLSIRTPIAHPFQVAVASWFGTPFLGWWLMRRAVREAGGQPHDARIGLTVAWLWLMLAAFLILPLVMYPGPASSSLASGVYGVGAVAQFVVAKRVVGEHARRHPPLQWVDVIAPAALVVFAGLVAGVAALLLIPW